MYADKYDELADLKAEEKKLKSVAKEKKKQAKLERTLQLKKKNITKLRDDAKEDVFWGNEDIAKVREKNKEEDEIYEKTGRYPSNKFYEYEGVKKT